MIFSIVERNILFHFNVYFVNSGSEAKELAMLMARLYIGNLGMILLRNTYHGERSSTIEFTASKTWKYSIPEVWIPEAKLDSFTTGSNYWDFETQGVIPNIVRMAKVSSVSNSMTQCVLFQSQCSQGKKNNCYL